jgi:peptide deformylase
MAILNILHFPDPRLRVKAAHIERVDDALRQLIDDMLETMYEAPGIGLAAVQVNVPRRLLVIDITEDKSDPRCYINPEIITHEGLIKMEEGCLSVPNIYEPVDRYEKIRVKALGRDGKPFEEEATGLLAVCLQHEIDHLDGKLFVDYLTVMKRERIKKKMEKLRRQTM